MGSLPDELKANQLNISKLKNVSLFNDQIRDGLKGSVFNSTDNGWATGKLGAAADVYAGIVGNTDFSSSFLTKWLTSSPTQSVNYVESHDNMTLADKIKSSVRGVNSDRIAQLSRFASSVAFLSQGVPFLQAGQEFLRSKNGNDNSYNADDATNSIKWSTKTTNLITSKYYQGIFALRAAHPAFRMTTTEQLKANLKFLNAANNVIAYTLNGKAVKDSATNILVIHNPNAAPTVVNLPNKNKWTILVKGNVAGTKPIETLTGNKLTIAGQTTMVLTQ
jgi:pullulanase